MRFGLEKAHLDYFHKHHYIVFEDLLSKKECEELKEAAASYLAKELRTEKEKLFFHPIEELYQTGFDTWRNHPIIKKYLFHHSLAELASELTKEKTVRMGFDQILITPQSSSSQEHLLPPIYAKETPLADLSCIQGITCGALFYLGGPTSSLPFFPQKMGSVSFISAHFPFSLKPLLQMPRAFYLLMTYAKDRALYRLTSSDPHTHEYKKKGYAFGDRLQKPTHPILFRRYS